MRHIFSILTLLILISSCGQNDTKQKELELKEKELALKQKELELDHNAIGNTIDTIKPTTNSNLTSQSDINLKIPVAKVPLTKAADVRKVHPDCNQANAPHSEGNTPLVEMYCGVLGQKPIEIYITSQNITTKNISGYSVVSNSRTNFEGKYTSRIHKGSNRKDILDLDETVYTLILREPSSSTKNGVFKLDFHINDTWTNGEGRWTSYDGMLYRGIKIYDRLNPDF